jgi:hypothetical protein
MVLLMQVTVFLLASLIHFTGITFYAVYASGELQVLNNILVRNPLI